MWLNQDSLTQSLTHAASTTEVRIHVYPLISISRTIQKYSTPNPGENSQKHSPISIFLCERNAQVILVTTTCYIISGDDCSKKRERIRGNKKGQVPETSKEKEKVRREVKMDKCPTIELGLEYPPEGKEKENIEHLILPEKFQKSKKGMYPLKRAQVELDFHHCYHHHHHTPFIRHTCTS